MTDRDLPRIELFHVGPHWHWRFVDGHRLLASSEQRCQNRAQAVAALRAVTGGRVITTPDGKPYLERYRPPTTPRRAPDVAYRIPIREETP
jgi:hypothetical protein